MPAGLKAIFLCYGSQKKYPENLVNVSGIPYNSDMFKSYWYVCQSCDASIEIVSKGIHFQDPSCNCSDPSVVWCQTNVVESSTTNERNTMEETTVNAVPDTYNSNMLVTYKQIENGETSYQTEKVVYIEMALDNARRSNKRADVLTSTIEEIKSFMTEDNWYNPNTEASEILTELERILDFNPTKTIEFSGMISFSGSIEVPLNESEDFDLFYHLQDNLTLDAYDGNIEIDSYEVDRVDGN